MLTSQAELLKQQLGAMKSGFQQTGGVPPTQAGTPQSPQTPNQARDGSQYSGYSFNGVPLTMFDYQNLKNYADTNDLAGFKAAFKAIADIHSRANAEYKGMNVVDATVSGYDTSGQYRNFSAKITVQDLQNWQQHGIVPPQFRGVLQSPNIAPIQKKSMGGAIRYMADGQQPQDRKSTRLNSSHTDISRMPSSA